MKKFALTLGALVTGLAVLYGYFRIEEWWKWDRTWIVAKPKPEGWPRLTSA